MSKRDKWLCNIFSVKWKGCSANFHFARDFVVCWFESAWEQFGFCEVSVLVDPFELEARYYDKIWGSACDYEGEALFLHRILAEHGAHRVLDLACGTGGHCLELAKLGYTVTGLDISRAMSEKAKEKLSKAGIKASFVLGDMKKAYSSLMNSQIALPFDAAICMGNSLAHMLDDRMLDRTLDEVWEVLKQNGVFIFWVKNAEHLRDDRLRQLKTDTIINEQDLQLAILNYNFRDSKNADILIWNALWLIKDHGKIDFQVRTHPLRWFRYDDLRRIVEAHGFRVLRAYGDTLGHEIFDSHKHETIFVTCQKE